MGISCVTQQTDSARPRGGQNAKELPQVLIVGSPNVGKSLLFNRLTGRYVTVSNYPGTSVEVSRGKSRTLGGEFEVVDTPGMYSLQPVTEEERVACRILLGSSARAVLHVVDAKNISRMLGLTLQLIEAGLPIVLVLNMADEARELGVKIDTVRLSELLGVPVVETVATSREGIDRLAEAVAQASPQTGRTIPYGSELEAAIEAISTHLGESDTLSTRARAMLLLQAGESDDHVRGFVVDDDAPVVASHVADVRSRLEHSVHYHATLAVRRQANTIIARTVELPASRRHALRERLSGLCMAPLTGIPILLLVVFVGLYLFVGVVGGDMLVNLLEEDLFEELINPWAEGVAFQYIPWEPLADLIAGEYGIITLALRYAIGLILPIVGTFFLAFSILEDSGYLPRLAMLIDRVFKKIGLNGRAVIPMVLGFGCDTMATIVTRTLESKRERIIACFLLALAVPCAAQLGVFMALLAGRPAALVIWAGVVALVFLAAGMLLARLMPGKKPSFYMELPPLRLPKPANVLMKTYTRMVWYFKEVLPLFVLASVVIWLGQLTGAFDAALWALTPVVQWLGLPDEASVAVLFGFFRRDYGAGGLSDIEGALTGNQMVVAAVTLTLFLPCVAQLLILKKERGWRMMITTTLAVMVIAFGAGWTVHTVLRLTGIEL